MAEPAQAPFEGYTLYVVFHKKEQRRYACLVDRARAHRITVSYARYLMSVHLGRILEKTEHVDHVNDDCLDDRIDNFQLLTPLENAAKYAKLLETRRVSLVCPICEQQFVRKLKIVNKTRREGRQLCCSRVCGGKQSHITANAVGQGS